MNESTQAVEQLIIDKVSGQISEQDELLLADMLGKDEDLKRLYQDTLLAYMAWKTHGATADEQVWDKLSAGLSTGSAPVRTPVKSFFFRPWAAAASILILGVLGYILYTFLARPGKPVLAEKPVIQWKLANGQVLKIDKANPGTVQADALTVNYDSSGMRYTLANNNPPGENATVSVPQGLDYYVALDDGTEVWLNAATELSFPLRFTGSTREVRLRGEAFFKVAKDIRKPFIVHTGENSVTVTGTAFNIKAYPGESWQTSLVEGAVKAKSSRTELTLNPGMAAVQAPEGELRPGEFEKDIVLGWMKGYYYFKDEPLSSIDPTLSRWYGRRFRYADGAISQIRFSGALEKAQSLEAFLRRLSAAANLGYRLEGNEVILYRQ